MTINPPVSMAISHQDPDLVFVCTAPVNSTSEIFRTTDGGVSWIDLKRELPHTYPMDITIDPLDDNNVYVVFSGFGNSHAYKSTNRGNEWINIGHGLPDVPTSAIIVDPVNPDYLYVGNDLGVFFSPDTGASWYDMNKGLPDVCMVTSLSSSPSNRKLRIATHGNGVYETGLIDEFVVGVKEPVIPNGFELSQNYPNPFSATGGSGANGNPTTTIEYTIPHFEIGKDTNGFHVTLKVYDILGREVAELLNERQSAGRHKVVFNAGDLSSGIYVYNLSLNDQIQSKKMLLIR
jgi:hypothetical protein